MNWFFILALLAVGAPVTRDGVTLNFVEAGEFRSGLVQGLEIAVVNESAQPVTVAVQLVLTRDGQEVKRTEAAGVTIPPQARQGFRVAEPRIYGQCRVNYEVKVNGAVLAADKYEFAAAGPYRLTLQPFFLSRNAVMVRLEILDPKLKGQQFRFNVLDKDRKRVLHSTEEYRRVEPVGELANLAPRVLIESLVSLGKSRPGDYVIEVEVLERTGVQMQARWRQSILEVVLARLEIHTGLQIDGVDAATVGHRRPTSNHLGAR